MIGARHYSSFERLVVSYCCPGGKSFACHPRNTIRICVNMAASQQTPNIQPEITELYFDVPKTKWPILYSSHYNIYLFGVQRLVGLTHGFDVGKWGHVYGFLKDAKMFTSDETVEPLEAHHQDLAFVHEEGYLQALKMSRYVAGILEFLPVALVPNGIVQSRILTPFRYQTGGTILGAKLALERGWAINIGGGFHHCHHSQGGGFCVYADITLAVRFLQHLAQKSQLSWTSRASVTSQTEGTLKTMIVDLDAHQGNGHERDFMKDDSVYIMDIYNRDIYPNDKWAKKAINKKIEVSTGIADKEYLALVESKLYDALEEFTPDLVVYNAGTDIMSGDPLGHMDISPDGIIKRDEIVFQHCRKREPPIPIVMVTSGGYQSTTARVIADSILNLFKNGLITPPIEQPSHMQSIKPGTASEKTQIHQSCKTGETPRSETFHGAGGSMPPSGGSGTTESSMKSVGEP